MERTNHQMSTCSIARTLEILGEKWTLLIIRESFAGATRFEQFQGVLQCPRNVLSDRLVTLVEAGILVRSEYREPGSRARHEYRLTERGYELIPILLALMHWGDRHEAGPEGPPVLARHAGCGQELRIAIVCAEGHEARQPEDFELVPGPGALPAVAAG